ncbi:hypothetical protein EST38_g1547 [Candolleomyces aberdarensis]|uniref:Uncharacterized protein n=1 Tax=Candolleomyces aberdarensis TaxID=2316362 RepID=A0A4Q2DVA4_9AGAR|nr:hypothetical protein EST38_g1547 [Candolleomyces aberdarensis]
MSELQLLRARIAQLEEKERLNAKKQKKAATSSKKKGSKDAAIHLASGLRPSYSTPKAARSPTPRAPSTVRTESPNQIGGFDDDDIEDSRPIPSIFFQQAAALPTQSQLATMTKGLPRNLKRANEGVVIAAQNPVQHAQGPVVQHAPVIPSRLPPSQRRTPTPQPSQEHQQSRPGSRRQTPTPHRQPRAPALQRHETFITTDPVAVKPTVLVVEPGTQKRSRRKQAPSLSANLVRSNDLPPFVDVDNRWKEVYLPTLYHTLYLSSETFLSFKSSSSEFHETVQDLIDLVYPEEEYKVSSAKDPIVLMSYNRINGARSSIAAEAMAVLQKYLRDHYNGRPGEAYEWLLWANSLETGPLFFANPAPFRQAAIKGDPDFVLERAVACLKPNTTTDASVLTNFCHAKWGGAIADYCHGFSTISPEKWTEILSLCQDGPQTQGFGAATVSQEARVAQRTNIFSFDSPSK